VLPAFTLLVALASLAMAAGHPQAAASSDVDQLLKSARRTEMPAGKQPGQAETVRTRKTKGGYLRTLAAPPAQDFPAPVAAPGNLEAVARSFLEAHRQAFGTSHKAFDLTPQTVRTLGRRTHVRFAQRLADIPVFVGEIVMQLNAAGGVEFVSNDIMTDDEAQDFESTWSAPVITDLEAADTARATLGQGNPGLQFQAEPATLMIYQPSIVGNAGPARLVWHTRVTSTPQPWVAERVLVDAVSGDIALRVSLGSDFLCRRIYDTDSSLQGYLRRAEGNPPYWIVPDVDCVYDALGSAYEFYRLYFGRDSIDNAGLCLEAFVRVCWPGPDEICPWPNARWIGGGANQFAFGAGFYADDVVAHEFTHGVIEFEGGLLSVNESGAIAESLCDSEGEFCDQTNGIGNDAEEVKWLQGEDLPGGAVRNMKNPPAYPYNHPDRKGSPNWRSLPFGAVPTRENDYGYVHSNCGVNNKLCYLLTDGTGENTFNGYRITGMGIGRVAALYYQVITGDLLPVAADYGDLYFALLRAAENLQWTWAESQNLENACRAVEIAETFWGNGTTVEVETEP